MTWKKLIIVLLILAGLVAGPYYLYQSGQLLQWQDQILTELENILDAEITVADFSLLPINQIRLQEVEIQREEELDIYLAEVHLYYDLRNLLEIFWRDRLETDLAEALLANLHQVWIREPELEIWNPEGEVLSELDLEDEMSLPDPAPIWRELPPLPAGAGLVVQGGSISYHERESGLSLELDRLEIKAQGEARLSAGLRGDVSLTGLEFSQGDGYLSRLDLTGLEAGLTLEDNSWELKADGNLEDLSQLEEPGRELIREYGFGDLNLRGSQKLHLTARGRRDELEDFQLSGITELEEVSFSRAENIDTDIMEENRFFPNEADEPILLEDIYWQTDFRQSEGRLVISDLTFNFLDNIFAGRGNLKLTGPNGIFGTDGQVNPDDSSGAEESKEDSNFLRDYYFELSGNQLELASLMEYLQLEIPAEIEEEIAPWSPGKAEFTLAVTPGTTSGISPGNDSGGNVMDSDAAGESSAGVNDGGDAAGESSAGVDDGGDAAGVMRAEAEGDGGAADVSRGDNSR